MLRVALTGGLASGKSLIGAMLRDLGAAVSQSDEVARAMMRPQTPLFQAIVQHFGAEAIAADGQLDRRMLARAAFSQGRLEELNALVHPAVIAAQAMWMQQVGEQDPNAVAVVESALVFETRHAPGAAPGDGTAPWRTRFDRIVAVVASPETRLCRYLQRVAGTDPAQAAEDFHRRNAAQWPDERRASLSDYVVRNEELTPAQLKRDVTALYSDLKLQAEDGTQEAM